jgi:hypothetical protein
MDRQNTLTKQQLDVYKKIDETGGMFIQAQDKSTKTTVTQLVKKGLVLVDEKGFIYAIKQGDDDVR